MRARKHLSKSEEVRAFLHPVRSRILDSLTSEARSVSEVAAQFGVHPANIAHHFRILEDAGLIVLDEIRHTGRNPAKCYRSTARTFDVVSEGTVDNANRLVLGLVRDDLAAGMAQLRGDDSEAALGLLLHRRWSRQSVIKIAERLESLLHELAAAEQDSGELNYS